MEKIKLSSRLLRCAEMVSKNSKIADIGTDHAYIPIYLTQNNTITHAIASDVKSGPLQNAIKNIEKYDLQNNIEARISDGTNEINENEADEIIIAGMGGNVISNILEKCSWENKNDKVFIINPMKYEERLREFLYENGYKITKETAVICSGKVYSVMKVIYTDKKEKINPVEKYIGKMWENITPAEKSYIKKQIKNLNNHLKGAKSRCKTEKEKYFEGVISSLKKFIHNEKDDAK